MKNNKKSLNELIFYTDRLLHRVQGGKHYGFGLREHPMEQMLIYLEANDNATGKELLEILKLRPKFLNKWLERLEDAELVELKASEEDKDVTLVKLTQTGLKAAEKAKQRRAEAEKLFECLSEEEKESLQRILLHLTDSLEAELKEECVGGEDFLNREDFWSGEGFWNREPFGSRESFGNREPFVRGEPFGNGEHYGNGENFCGRGAFAGRDGFGREGLWNRGRQSHNEMGHKYYGGRN